MYYILYPILYLLSLLPFFILYGISDFFFFITYYLSGYRKKIVLANLDIAFPEKTTAEKKIIAKKFYRNLVDTFLEAIKLLSISEDQVKKRAVMDFTIVKELLDKGKNVQLHSGHQMNWEYGNWAVATQVPVPWIGIYMRINNKALDRIFYKIRNKDKTVLVAVQEFKARAHNCFKEQYTIGLAADQNPGSPSKAYWLNFFNKPAPFVTGPDNGARKNNTAVVFVRFVKVKRGHYRFDSELVTENAAELQEGKLTLLYRDFLEETIKRNPDNYLWSHRRWKWPYKPAYEKRWIDTTPAPL
jgi:Kdo2-lipid IVA lauroyltransferase/acyltransferase